MYYSVQRFWPLLTSGLIEMREISARRELLLSVRAAVLSLSLFNTTVISILILQCEKF